MDANVEKTPLPPSPPLRMHLASWFYIDNVYTAFDVDDNDDSVKRSNSSVQLAQINQSIKWQCYTHIIKLSRVFIL